MHTLSSSLVSSWTCLIWCCSLIQGTGAGAGLSIIVYARTHTHTQGLICISASSYLHSLLLSFEVLHQLYWIRGMLSLPSESVSFEFQIESEVQFAKINTMRHRKAPFLVSDMLMFWLRLHGVGYASGSYKQLPQSDVKEPQMGGGTSDLLLDPLKSPKAIKRSRAVVVRSPCWKLHCSYLGRWGSGQ